MDYNSKRPSTGGDPAAGMAVLKKAGPETDPAISEQGAMLLSASCSAGTRAATDLTCSPELVRTWDWAAKAQGVPARLELYNQSTSASERNDPAP